MPEVKRAYKIPAGNRLARSLLRPVFQGIFHTLSRVRFTGLNNIPGSGPYLIAINHLSLFEPPFVLTFWPVAPEAVAAVEIWERRGQATLVRLYGALQVHRGEYDRIIIDKVLAALAAGYPVAIFPEGGRSHKPGLRQALPGLAFILDKARVPVVPVGVVGATDDFLIRALHGKRPDLEMHIGRPLLLPPITGKGEERRQERLRNVDLVMEQIARLLPAEYRGIYAEQVSSE
jgi:1-acyl-sn-glycerol-3-phosphate acyltransferase